MLRRTRGKSPQEIEWMRESGQVVAGVHRALRESVAPGMTTKELDEIAFEQTKSLGAKPNFLGYGGFPASVCISVNEEIVHGIPGARVLGEGDIVSFDCGAVIERGGKPWHSDAAFTVVLDGGDASARQKREELSAITEHSLWAGIARLATATRIGQIGEAVEQDVFEQGQQYGWEPDILQGYSGHAIGNRLHEDPQVWNYATRDKGPRISAGTVICIEPMLTEGSAKSRTLADEWTVVTQNGLASAHWEHTVAVSDKGVSVLTAADAGAAGLAPFGITPVTNYL